MERTTMAMEGRSPSEHRSVLPLERMWRACLLALLLVGFATSASAQDAVLLAHVCDGGITDEACRVMEDAAAKALTRPEAPVADHALAVERLNQVAPEVLNCFTAECLTRAGEALLASTGYRVSVAQKGSAGAIVVESYDLVQGTLRKRVQGECEGCSSDELASTVAAACAEVIASEPSAEPKRAQVPTSAAPAAAAVIPADTVQVAIFADPIDAEIAIDGQVLASGKFVGTLPPGKHAVRVSREGYSASDETLELQPGSGPTYFIAHLRPLVGPTQVGRRGGWMDQVDRQALSWGLTGGGSLLILGGTVLLAMDGEPNCQGGTSDCPERFETSIAGGISLALGGAALTSGVIFFLWDDFAGTKPQEGVAWGFAPIHDRGEQWEGGQLWMRGQF